MVVKNISSEHKDDVVLSFILEKEYQLCRDLNIDALSIAFTGDSHKTVLNTYNNKKQNIQRLKTQLEMIEKETQAQMQEIENTNAQLNVNRIPNNSEVLTDKVFLWYTSRKTFLSHSLINTFLQELNNKLSETQAENQRLRNQFRAKQQEWNEFKRKRDGLTNG